MARGHHDMRNCIKVSHHQEGWGSLVQRDPRYGSSKPSSVSFPLELLILDLRHWIRWEPHPPPPFPPAECSFQIILTRGHFGSFPEFFTAVALLSIGDDKLFQLLCPYDSSLFYPWDESDIHRRLKQEPKKKLTIESLLIYDQNTRVQMRWYSGYPGSHSQPHLHVS